MTDYKMFTCRDCHHVAIAVIADHRKCEHPCIAEADLEGEGLKTFTKADWKKIYVIVNEILQLDITLINGKVPNFDFPNKYDPVWITACRGFKPSTHIKAHTKVTSKTFSGENVDESMGEG